MYLPDGNITTIAMADAGRVHSSDVLEVLEKTRGLTYCQYADASSS